MNGPTHLDGAGLRGALLTANEYVQRHRADLNRINVFPVPDGDTGTNLALTVSSIADRLRGGSETSIGEVARQASEAAIMGARGNCGMILSHFLLGFSDAVGPRVRLGVGEFASVWRQATEHVYRALEKPVEGTMITIMRAIADEADRLQHSDFIVLFERLLVKAREALAGTPDLLPALKAAGVVDAGAKGFVHLLEGISSFVAGDPLVPAEDDAEWEAEPAFAAATVEYPAEAETYRFCTEALVRGAAIPDSDAVRGVLREKGDSLVVIRTADLLKVHIHTDEPDDVFAYLRTLGRLATHKAEDMRAQHATMERTAAAGHMTLARRPVSIVADTACDLPDEIVRAHGIHLVPLSLIFGDRVLRDRFDISAGQFAEELKKGAHPGTSQPPPALFLDAFRRAAEEGESVVGVILSSGLSGTYASAQAAAKQHVHDSVPVHLFDSRGGSVMQGLLALKAAELGELGWAPERIVAELERVRKRSGILVVLDTFERALASGRVGRGRAWLGSLLDIKPILEVDDAGKLNPVARVRGRRQVMPKVMELLEERVPRNAKKLRFGVFHVAIPEILDEVAGEVRARYGQDREVLTAAGTPIIATHAGEGAWGLAWMIED
ncbi:DegV family protein [Longimicrobium sp.]|uniref:DegV family protein n=1 Tax=Longimicrobium sp. TaxID=2029185 RepID=UPI002CAEEC8F|nr:DegV family protein [Longimicrobium sp.]HSU16858.1 DegV family protein [Longimicrobium sp.]